MDAQAQEEDEDPTLTPEDETPAIDGKRKRSKRRSLGGVYSRTPGSWTIAWTFNGKQYRETHRGISKKEATAIRARKMADQTIGKYVPEAKRNAGLTLGDAKEEWSERRPDAKKAAVFWRQILRDGLTEKTPIKTITSEVIADWRAKQRKRITEATLLRMESVLRGALKPKRFRTELPEAPWEDLPPLKQGEPRKRTATDAQIKAILDVAPAWLQRAIVLAFRLALRRGELAQVRWSMLHTEKIDGHKLTFLTLPAEITKTSKERVLPVPEDVLSVLENEGRPKDTDVLIVGKGVDKVSKAFDVAKKKAGVEISLHDGRRTVATSLARGGVEVMQISAITGHRSLKVLQDYVRLAKTDLHSILAKAKPKT